MPVTGARPLHILALVTDAFGGHGGIALYNRDFLKALCSCQNVSEVTAIPRIIVRELEETPANLKYVTQAVGGKWRYAREVLRCLIRKPGADLIVCGHINLLPLAFLLRFWLRVPVLLEIYGIDAWQPSSSRLLNYLARRVDAVVSISEVTKQRFMAWTGCPAERVFILPNAIHLERYGMGPKTPELLARYGLERKKILMTLGRLAAEERYKGFDQVLAILPALSEIIPNIAYLIAGAGSDRERLEKKARNLGLSDRVIFTGMVAEEEKADHYRLADVYVMPSRGEGFGFVLLEAMACGIPVIASKTDGGREAVRQGEIGALVDPGNATEIIDAITSALASTNRKIPDGLQYFSFENFQQRAHQIVSKMIARRNELTGWQ